MTGAYDVCPTCGKRSYPSRKRATEVAKWARRGRDVKGSRRPPITVYVCEGGSIHLTSSKDRDHPETTKRKKARRRGR